MENRKKDILLHLYGEASEGADLHGLLKDPELRSEHAALSEAKFRLDHRSRKRPDASVIDGIFAATPGAVTEPGRRAGDRPARSRPTHLRKVLLPALSIAAAVLFGVAVGWFAAPSSPDKAPALSDGGGAPDLVPPETLYRFVPPTTNGIRPTGTLSWDDADELRQVYRRIESMQPKSSLSWDEPPVPLESLPVGRSGGILPAGSNR